MGRERDDGGARLAGDSPGAREAGEEAPRRRRFGPPATIVERDFCIVVLVYGVVNKPPLWTYNAIHVLAYNMTSPKYISGQYTMLKHEMRRMHRLKLSED